MIQPEFQSLYNQLIEKFQVEGKVQPEKIIHQEDPILGKILTDILLADEEHQLHNWEKKNIFVKDRKSVVGQLVSETILTFRRLLVDQK
jgi:DNA primase